MVYHTKCLKCGYQGINIYQNSCLACGGKTRNEGGYEEIEAVLKEILEEIALLSNKVKKLMEERYGKS